MKKNIVIFSAIAIIAAASLLMLARPTEAITISQLNLEIVARPGETIDQLVQLYDESFTGSTIYPVVYNFTDSPEKEGAALVLTDEEDLKEDRAWVVWSADAITAANAAEAVAADTPSSTAPEVSAGTEPSLEGYRQEEIPLTLPVEGTLFDFPYKIVIPADAEPGTHLISLVFQQKPAAQTGTEGTAVYIGSNVATNIFLKVLGATIDDISVDFQAGSYSNRSADLSPAERKKYFTPKTFFLKPPVDFLVNVSNNGNTHQKPDGNISIVNDLFGSTPEVLEVNAENRIILPGTDRTFEAPSFGQGLMFGKYRAKLTLLYGDPLRPVQEEIVFWIVPLVEILIVLGALLLIVTIIIVIRKRQKSKKRKQDQRREEELRAKIIAEVKGQAQAQKTMKAPEQKSVPPSAAPEAVQKKKKNGKPKVQNSKAAEAKPKTKA